MFQFDILPVEITDFILILADVPIITRFVCKEWKNITRNIGKGDVKTFTENMFTNGYLSLMKWARENGCPWNKWTCAYAAQNGHLDVLKWARENGCTWNKWTCAHAAQNGHLDVLI